MRKGLLHKGQLQTTLKRKYGISPPNFDLLLSSFIRLGIFSQETWFGDEYLFLHKDYFLARLPPGYVKSDDILGEERREYQQQVQEFFARYLEPSHSVVPAYIFTYFEAPAFALLQELGQHPLLKEDALDLLKGDDALFSEMVDRSVLTEINGRVFLLAGPSFLSIVPSYVIGELKQRYLDGQVPVEILLRELEILENMD